VEYVITSVVIQTTQPFLGTAEFGGLQRRGTNAVLGKWN